MAVQKMSATGYDLITEEMLQEALARIEALEAALRTIRLQNVEPYCREIARAALDKDATMKDAGE